MEEEREQVYSSGSVIVNVTRHPLTGWRVHVHLYSTWGHSADREQYLFESNMANEAFEVISEEVGQWLLSVQDDLSHTLPV